MRQHPTALQPADALGRRVVVRHRLHDGEHAATDVIGVVEGWSSGVIQVRTSAGAVVTIDESDVLAAKVVPARTVTRREVRDLESAAVQGWRGNETATIGAWLLRAGGGFTGRANSCMPLDDPGIPVVAAVERVERWYAERELRPAFQVPVPLGGTLSPVLDALGWPAAEDETVVMTASIDDVRAAARSDLPPVHVADRPDDAWLAAYHYRGGELPAHAVRIMLDAETVGFGGVDDPDGELTGRAGARVAVARGAVSSAPSGHRWLGVTAVEVAPEVRRRGLGSHVMAGVAVWGAEHGATDVYVQVAAENRAAIATYERLGFGEHHRYHYRRRPTPR